VHPGLSHRHVVDKCVAFDCMSIHIGYITLIRNAQRYLYLENQYFLGSAHLWERLVSSTAALAWKGCICDAVDGNNDCLGIKPAADMLISLA